MICGCVNIDLRCKGRAEAVTDGREWRVSGADGRRRDCMEVDSSLRSTDECRDHHGGHVPTTELMRLQTSRDMFAQFPHLK